MKVTQKRIDEIFKIVKDSDRLNLVMAMRQYGITERVDLRKFRKALIEKYGGEIRDIAQERRKANQQNTKAESIKTITDNIDEASTKEEVSTIVNRLNFLMAKAKDKLSKF